MSGVRLGAAVLVSAMAHAGLGLAVLLASRSCPSPAQATEALASKVAAPVRVRLLGAPESAAAEPPPAEAPAKAPAPTRGLAAVDRRPVARLQPASDAPSEPDEAPAGEASLGQDIAQGTGGQGVGSEGPGTEASGTAKDGGAGDSRGSGGSGAGAPGQGAARGPDVAALHRRLAESAQRCYPPAAKRFRLEGQVGLNFCLAGGGSLASLALDGSTGSSLLDRAAEECVVQGALPLPVASGCYSVPVRFARTE